MSTALDAIHEKFSTFDLKSHTIGLCVIGSESHGTKIAPMNGGVDDTDYMGIVIPPKRHLLGLGSWEHWVYGPDEQGLDVTIYSLKKLVGLLLKCNPNVVGTLWLRDEFYVDDTDVFQMLRANRDAFSSKQAYNAFVGYAHSQLRKMNGSEFKGYMGAKRKAIVERHGYDCKNASHLVRLLTMGIEFLRTGELNVYREDREMLMAIKRGEWPLDKVKQVADDLFKEARDAVNASPLPPDPDFARAENILIELTESMIA
jgi:predicted nucleotidyltransferase